MTKPKNFPGRVKARREGALRRLEQQLKAGTKREKKTDAIVPLTEKDRERINKQIETLKQKL